MDIPIKKAINHKVYFALQIIGECPSPNSIPIMYDDEHFTCAKKWYGPGNPESIDACNGCDYGESYTMR